MTTDRPLDAVLAQALAGSERPLFDFLARVSGLPGTRHNEAVVEAFAAACAGHGKRADALLHRMAALHPDEAPGGTALEFLPVCATAALGQRIAGDERSEAKLLPLLHELAEDMRFRVRDAVPAALAAVGARRGDALLHATEGWMDGFFHAAAVLRALARAEWITQVSDGELVVTRLRQAFRLLDGASRSASRYPGYKALQDAIAAAPKVFAPRFGVAVFQALEELGRSKDPHLRELLRSSVADRSLRGRFGPEVEALGRALDAEAKPPRDPTRIVHGTRRRGRRST